MLTTLNKQTTSLANPELRSSSQFLSRIFTDVNGRQFRLTFLVAVVAGELRGHLVSAEPLSTSSYSHASTTAISADHQIAGTVSCSEVAPQYCLPISLTEKEPATEYVASFAPVVSPYFSLEFLINSQPTRAPSHN